MDEETPISRYLGKYKYSTVVGLEKSKPCALYRVARPANNFEARDSTFLQHVALSCVVVCRAIMFCPGHSSIARRLTALKVAA